MREAKGLAQGQVVAALDWSLSKVNRIESGNVIVSARDLRALLRQLDVADAGRVDQLLKCAKASRRRGWWDEPKYRERLTPAMMQMLQFETEASAISVYQPTLIPELLQTQGYAQSAMDFWSHELPAVVRAARLEARMGRRDEVFGRPDGPEYLVILDESVLLREVGVPQVMAEQLHDLLAFVQKRDIALRILPLSDGALMCSFGSITILDLGKEENAILYREGPLWDDVSDAAGSMRHLFEQMWEQSLSEEASMRSIEARAAMLLSL
jgi:transcriptional regulator with XRE-family HTH domain